MRAISMHQMSVVDLPVERLIDVSAAAGCRHVCLFTQQPGEGVGMPAIDDARVQDVRRRLDDHGMSALGITSFPILAGRDPEAYAAGIARGARLGATCANARIVDTDPDRAADSFARFAQLCAAHGILACIEFTGYGRSRALAQARAIVRHAGCGAITLDPLHVVRTGLPWDELAALPAAEIGYVQLCDGRLAGTEADYRREQAEDRLPLGEGEFPLAAMLALVPADMPVTLEIPCRALREQGFDAAGCVTEIVARARDWLARH